MEEREILKVSVRTMQSKKIWLAIAGCEDRSRPQVKDCRQPLEAGKGKQTDSPIDIQKERKSCQHFDFNLLRVILDF